jgi:hypothetical protein
MFSIHLFDSVQLLFITLRWDHLIQSVQLYFLNNDKNCMMSLFYAYGKNIRQ